MTKDQTERLIQALEKIADNMNEPKIKETWRIESGKIYDRRYILGDRIPNPLENT